MMQNLKISNSCEVKFDMSIATFNFDVKNVGGRSTDGNSSKRCQTQFQTQFVKQTQAQ